MGKLQARTKWELKVKDNGKGIHQPCILKTLTASESALVQDIAQTQLKGSFSYYDDNGAIFRVEFVPVAA